MLLVKLPHFGFRNIVDPHALVEGCIPVVIKGMEHLSCIILGATVANVRRLCAARLAGFVMAIGCDNSMAGFVAAVRCIAPIDLGIIANETGEEGDVRLAGFLHHNGVRRALEHIGSVEPQRRA